MEARWEMSPVEDENQHALLRFGSRRNRGNSPKSLKMFISSGFWAGKGSKEGDEM